MSAPAETPPTAPEPIEVVQTAEYYILVRGEHSLWWRRADGAVSAGSAWDLAAAARPACLGVCQALVGRLQAVVGGPHHLLLVRESAPVGHLPSGHVVRKVTRVAHLPLTPAPPPDAADCQLEPCAKHAGVAPAAEARAGLARTWGLMKTVTAATVTAAQSAGAQVKERVPGLRRAPAASPVLDDVLKLFNDADAFYFSEGGDLSNSLQRRLDGAPPDVRFVWNWPITEPLRALPAPAAAAWLQPLVQGFVHVSELAAGGGEDALPAPLRLTLISRRSRLRAGTRYRRRGVDENGDVANYVETEQVVSCGGHHLSLVQVRGSVPVFWAQPGYKYRPPPRLERDPAETQAAFARHINAELGRFDAVHAVSLLDLAGRERVLADAYLDHALVFDSEQLTFTAFDFHEHCRGLHFENVSLLLAAAADELRAAGFAWADERGLLCRQRAVFRTSCMDCLDRTNVVQTALGRAALCAQLAKLGFTSGAGLPAPLRAPFQRMWADTGDALSRQYAGTGALKADFTRTGERRWTGLMRDGVNSASRYYLNRFRDAARQAAIDASLGQPAAGVEPLDEPDEPDEPEEAAAVERVRQLLLDCQRLLLPESAVVLGAWALIDADPDTGDAAEQEMDTMLVLTTDSYYVACYDDDTDRIVSYQRVPLADLQALELGPLEVSRLSRSPRPPCLRLWYEIGGEAGFFHQLRATPLRFFNNVPVSAGSTEERVETLRALAAALAGACEAAGHQVPLSEGRLDRRRSRAALASSRRGRAALRWLDEPQETLRSAGSRAVNSVTAWLPPRLRLWDAERPAARPAADGGQSVTERNSPAERPPPESGDMLMDSAGIIARSARPTAAAPAVETNGELPEPAGPEAEPAPAAAEPEAGSELAGGPTDAPAPAAPPPAASPVPEITVSGGQRPAGGLSLLGSALSPLASPARDTVLVGFSRLARGVQRLGGAGAGADLRPSAVRKLELSELLRDRIAASRTRVTLL